MPTIPPRPQPAPGLDDDLHAARLDEAAHLVRAARRYQHARNAIARYYGMPPAPSYDRLSPDEQAVILGGLVAVRRLWQSTQ